eukprot:1420847-Prymnesium_polylepis.1
MGVATAAAVVAMAAAVVAMAAAVVAMAAAVVADGEGTDVRREGTGRYSEESACPGGAAGKRRTARPAVHSIVEWGLRIELDDLLEFGLTAAR